MYISREIVSTTAHAEDKEIKGGH